MAGIGYKVVDYVELEKAISQLSSAKDKLNSQLMKIKGIIDGSVNNPEIYLSPDARVTKEQFDDMYNRWAGKFDNYVQEYVDYFKKAKSMYAERAEIEKRNAQELNSFID